MRALARRAQRGGAGAGRGRAPTCCRSTSRSWPATPRQVGLAIEAVNIVTDGVDATWALHVCYGNRYARPLWEGHYDFLFPAVLDAHVDQLVLEFARKGDDDLRLFEQYDWDRGARARA